MLFVLAAAALAPTPYVLIKCEKPVIAMGEKPVFKIVIGNKGRAPVLVVQPNDGSDWHWRTPHTGWAVKETNDKTAWPAKPSVAKDPRYGNMNPLTDKELVSLKPGQSVELDQSWLHQKPVFKKPGKYKVVFYYWHTNANPASGPELPTNASTAIKDRIMASEPYRLRSNELIITVK